MLAVNITTTLLLWLLLLLPLLLPQLRPYTCLMGLMALYTAFSPLTTGAMAAVFLFPLPHPFPATNPATHQTKLGAVKTSIAFFCYQREDSPSTPNLISLLF